MNRTIAWADSSELRSCTKQKYIRLENKEYLCCVSLIKFYKKIKTMNRKQIILAAAMVISMGCYAQTTTLQLSKGQKFEVITVTNLSSVAELMGQTMESTVDNNSTKVYEVIDKRNTETDISYSTTKVKANMQAMGQEMDYDSDKKDNAGPLAEQIGNTVGKVNNMTINASGKVIKEDNTEKISGGMMNMVSASLSNHSLFYTSLLGRDLKQNNSIPDSVVVDSEKMKSKIVGSYTVQSVENNIATVLFTGTQTMNGVVEQMGQEMNMTGSGKVNAEIKLNVTTGIILESKTTIDGTNNIDAMGMSIPVTLKSTSTSTVKAIK